VSKKRWGEKRGGDIFILMNTMEREYEGEGEKKIKDERNLEISLFAGSYMKDLTQNYIWEK